VKQGIWFVQTQWAIKSLTEAKRLREKGYQVKGGIPTVKPVADVAHGRVKASKSRRTVEELLKILKIEAGPIVAKSITLTDWSKNISKKVTFLPS
jgi:hypothetical protein